MVFKGGKPPAAQLDVPFTFLAQLIGRLFISGLGILTIQLGLSILIRNTVWPITIGVASLILTNMATAGNPSGWVATFWPYSLTAYTGKYMYGSEMGNWLLPSEWQGLLWTLLALPAFMFYNYRGSLKLAFRSVATWGLPFLACIILWAGSWYVQKPKPLPLLTGRTVIAGRVEAPALPDSIKVFNSAVETEIAAAGIDANGYFHLEVPLTSDVENLVLRASLSNSTYAYAGKGDSLFVRWQIGKNPALQKVEIRGTGIANNQFMRQRDYSYSMVEYYLSSSNNDPGKPVDFFDDLLEEWKRNTNNVLDFKTADGYAVSTVMQSLQEKLIAVRYLDYAYFGYPAKFKVEKDDKDFLAGIEKVKPILAKVPEFDSSLVGWPAYHQFLRKWLVRNISPNADKDSAYRQMVLQQREGPTRDRLLFDLCQSRMELSRDSLSRAVILQDIAFIDNKQYQKLVQEKSDLLNRLRKGQLAPLFAAHNLSNQPESLTNLRGKFVAIDVWATWCGPCRTQSPVFEKMAVRYKDQPITFLALSLDENKNAWEKFLNENKPKIAHWRAPNLQQFRALYGIEAIPRFLLIDPAGNFVNANLPQPTDANFEVLLRQALGLKDNEG
jgi:thiol-disulfide isomerase/thioredoxin